MVADDLNVLIVGGGGFIGSHLAERFLRLGARVSIFDRPNLIRPDNLSGLAELRWFEGEFTNHEDLAEVIEPGQVVVHLVSTTLPKSSNDNPIFDVESNLVGTLRLLELIRQKGARKIVFVSSGGTVYGIPERTPISEDDPTDPICSYGITKLAIEKYLHLYKVLHHIDYVVCRLSNPYGERQRVGANQGAVAVFMDRIKSGKAIDIWGDGQVVRDYIYIDDAVDAIVLSVINSGVSGVFNVGSGKGVSLDELISAISSVTGLDSLRNYLPPRGFDVPVSVLNIEKARGILSWTPKTDLKDGLSMTWAWLRECD